MAQDGASAKKLSLHNLIPNIITNGIATSKQKDIFVC
jgi:hypothetical protein